MRLFLAIEVPEDLRTALKPVLRQLRVPGMKPVAPENLHVTVKFLGEVDAAGASWVRQRLERLDRPVTLRTTHFGTFGSRTYWLGVAGEGLQELFDAVEQALVDRFPKEVRVFHPHITLARAKGADATPGDWKPADGDFSASWDGRLALYRSDLRPEGPKYTRITKF